jgi:hypothetical protein
MSMLTPDEGMSIFYEFVQGWAPARCVFCKPIRTVSREVALTIFPPISHPVHIQLQSCPYTHIRIGKRIYKRVVENKKTCDYWKELPTYCHSCGIVFGNVHHIGCGVESCAKCGEQFMGCGCCYYYGNERYFIGHGDKKGRGLPRYGSWHKQMIRTYRRDREEGLKIFIEHYLHERKIPQDEIKKMAKEFDNGNNAKEKGFEDIWNESMSFVQESNEALAECNRQKPRPTPWSTKDKRSLK